VCVCGGMSMYVSVCVCESICMYVSTLVAVLRHIRRGHWIALQMVVSHHVVAGI